MKEWLCSLIEKLYLLDDKLGKEREELWQLYCETSRHGEFRTIDIKNEVLNKIQNKRIRLRAIQVKIEKIIRWIEVRRFFKGINK